MWDVFISFVRLYSCMRFTYHIFSHTTGIYFMSAELVNNDESSLLHACDLKTTPFCVTSSE